MERPSRTLLALSRPLRPAGVHDGRVRQLPCVGHTAVEQSGTFTIVPGLAAADCRPFRDCPGRCSRRFAHAPRADHQSTDTFRADSSPSVVTP